MRVLVTGYGPFGDVKENPSAWLAERSGAPFQVLDVTFEAADAFLEELDPDSFDALLMLGVAVGAKRMRFETVGRNAIGPVPDVSGAINGPGPIDPKASFQLGSTLWTAPGVTAGDDLTEVSHDAGDYLCNYILFRALQRFPDKHVGFLHVAVFDTIPAEEQLRVVQDVVGRAEAL